jgi:hypothetical protein
LSLTEKRGINNGGYCPRITSKAEQETEVLSVLLIIMSFNLVRLPEEQGILTNAEEEEEQVLLEVITRMVFDAGLQRIAEAVNDSIDIVTSCHHQEPENPKNYTLENLATTKDELSQENTHTHTHTHTQTLILTSQSSNNKKPKRLPFCLSCSNSSKMTVLFVVPGPVLKQLHRERNTGSKKRL